MKCHVVPRTLIELAVGKGLRDMETDPARSVRNLVDLGRHFARGRFQTVFFPLAQTMLKNEDSAYYQLMRNTVSRVDHETLKTFGVNVGYTSWTKGADELRKHQLESGFHIPWTVLFADRGVEGPVLDARQMDALIEQGKDLGIYTYLVLCGRALFLPLLLQLAEGHSGCGFVFFLPPGELSRDDARAIRLCRNAMFVIPAGGACRQAARQLCVNHCLFGVYAFYEDNTVDRLLSSGGDGCLLHSENSFAFLIAAPGCGETARRKAKRFVREQREGQRDPVFWVDLPSDLMEVDRIISGEAELLRLDTAGGLQGFGKEAFRGAYDPGRETLAEIFRRTMPPAAPGLGAFRLPEGAPLYSSGAGQ